MSCTDIWKEEARLSTDLFSGSEWHGAIEYIVVLVNSGEDALINILVSCTRVIEAWWLDGHAFDEQLRLSVHMSFCKPFLLTLHESAGTSSISY